MGFLKGIILLLVWGSCCYIGYLLSKKYIDRVSELKEMKIALTMFETKAKFTYEPIPTIFEEIAKKGQGIVGDIFQKASSKMKEKEAGQVWEETLEEIVRTKQTAMKVEDIKVLKGLSKLLGKVDIEGQLSEIALVSTFLEEQIRKAEEEKQKSSKMYKTLGATLGTAIVVILL